ncbi:MAG: D-glycero-beta-D-manno-heptose 1,7-bisphosphate 7-phosphatase [Epsilonproteobacteria bacterium]|nr:D-glycero-beta-D-manno-heptose 1,7-bisphosphate 7-phosphatase [Campylobacterota bacterium]
MKLKTNKALFLDRDGVINIDKSYVSKIEDFEFTNGIFEVLKKYQKEGYLLIVVTNQSGIGRGYYTSEDFETLTAWKLDELKKREIFIDEVYHCHHDPDSGCGCRKPAPGMLLSAKEKFDIDMENSWMVGDKKSDIDAAYNAGVNNTILIAPECHDKKGARYCVNSILDIIDIIK